MRKCFLIVLAVLMTITLSACLNGAGGGDDDINEQEETEETNEFVIGVAMARIDHDYMKTDVLGMQYAADELGVVLNIQSCQNNASDQSKQIENMIEQQVDAIICVAADVDAIMDSVKKCNEAGIPFIYNSRILKNTDEAKVDYGVGYSPEELTGLGAKWLLNYAKKNDKELVVFELMGALTDSHSIFCRDAFEKVVNKNEDVFTQHIRVSCEWDAEIALNETIEAFQQNPGINCIFMHSDLYLPSVQSALNQLGKYYKEGEEGHIILAPVGGEGATLDALKEGYVDVVMSTPIYQTGRLSVEFAVDAILGNALEGDEYILPGFLVDRENFDTAAYKSFGYLGKE